MDKHMQEKVTKKTTSQDVNRILEVDFLKGVLILLMIAFHLAWIGDHYPFAKQVVYTFHMPAFLVISGFLMNVHRSLRTFMRSMCRLAVPYVVMESAYIVMAATLPIREHISDLSLRTFCEYLILHPLGPYWYLHTLIICGVVYFIAIRITCLNTLSRLILIGLAYYGLSSVCGIIAFVNAMYFLAGAVVRKSSIPFKRIFQGSSMAFIAAVTIIAQSSELQSSATSGILLTFLINSTFIFAFQLLNVKRCSTLLWLGQNTLPILLFSPIFTYACKWLQPYLLTEPTGILFLSCSLVITASGSLLLGRVLDLLMNFLPSSVKRLLPQLYRSRHDISAPTSTLSSGGRAWKEACLQSFSRCPME